MKTPFPPNKTIKQLGIDITKKFVVVSTGGTHFNLGDIVVLSTDDDTTCPLFKRISDGWTSYSLLSPLAYADRKEITWDNIEVGDKIKPYLDATIVEVFTNIFAYTNDLDTNQIIQFVTKEFAKKDNWKIVQPEEEMTLAEVCKTLGTNIKIVN